MDIHKNPTDFVTLYKNAVHTGITEDPQISADSLIPNVYRYVHSRDAALNMLSAYLHLLAGGSVCVEFPISFSFHFLDCFLILYTVKGSGQIVCSGRSVPAAEKHLLFLDCRQNFSLQSSGLPWDFKLFFFGGDGTGLFTSILNPSSCPSFPVPDFSMTERHISSLLSLSVTPNLSELLQMHQSLTSLLSDLCIFSLPDTPAAVSAAPYLIELHDYLERHYADEFSLSSFEKRLQVSRYRLCREFSAVYGMPPLKYLTRRRIEEAKKMLLTTDLTVHEISSAVGYGNTNNFIALFKKYTGTTPGVFRQTHQIRVPKEEN